MTPPPIPMTEGDYVVVRCSAAGVHAGRYLRHDGPEVHLTDARRLWYWRPARGAFLSGVARYGLASDSKVGTAVDIILLDACEIIAASKDAAESIIAHPSSHE